MVYLDNIFNEAWNQYTYIFNIVYGVIVLFMLYIVVSENGNPNKTLSWLLVIILLPIAGILLYLYFGKSYRRRKMFMRKEFEDLVHFEKSDQAQVNSLKDKKLSENSPVKEKINIVKLLFNNNKALLTAHNQVEVLNNGSKTFASIIYALKQAKHHIHLEFYNFASGDVGNKIKDILVEKVKKGVKVRLIYDAVGSWGIKKKFINSMKEAGIEVYSFLPVRLPKYGRKINYRNHRKIVVVDGTVGFVGGLNVADHYLYGSKDIGGVWRDTHLKIVGDAVQGLQKVFISDWYFCSNNIIKGDTYFPKHNISDIEWVQITTSGPDSDWASILQAYFSAINTAKKHIYIATPYFIPNESILLALKTAALSGIDVRIILPSKSDSQFYLLGTLSYVEELLEAGIKIYTYQKGFIHSKLMMADSIFSSVGTANMDIRSLDKNFEVNALIYNEKITKELEQKFMDDLIDCKKIEQETFKNRSKLQKIKESVARVLCPLV